MLIIIKDVIYKKNLRIFFLNVFLIVIMIFRCETAYNSTLKNQQAKKMRENVLLDRN